MDGKQKFDLFINSSKEEEKEYYFLDDPDEEKIIFEDFRKHTDWDFDFIRGFEEDCSDCDKDCKSKILAELPTNDSNSYIFEHGEEEQEATKFLTRIGLLERIDDNEIFAVTDMEPTLQKKVHDDFEISYFNWNYEHHQIDAQNEKRLFFEDDKDSRILPLTDKEKELLDEGLPILTIESDLETFHEPEISRQIQTTEKTTQGESKDDHFKDYEEEIIDTTPNIVRTRKKTTEFNHLLERKTFRMMRKYYKKSFERFASPYNYKTNVKIMNPEEMDQLVIGYMKSEFDFLLGLLAGNELMQMAVCLKRIILSDRYNKGDRVTYGIDFTTVRNLFNRYSTKALNEFISIPVNSILIVHFYLKQGKILSFTQNDVDRQKLNHQMQWLIRVAFGYLPPNFVEVYSHQTCQLINFLN
jgi:hypothetical protein